jgi:uncharacterized protein with GYD domain
MPKYLIQGSYTPGVLRGLAKDRASGRKAAVQAAMKNLKGKVESSYFTLGSDDVVVIVEAPDNVAVVALSLSVGSTGLVRTSPGIPNSGEIRADSCRSDSLPTARAALHWSGDWKS